MADANYLAIVSEQRQGLSIVIVKMIDKGLGNWLRFSKFHGIKVKQVK